jgi:hypothetical protein
MKGEGHLIRFSGITVYQFSGRTLGDKGWRILAGLFVSLSFSVILLGGCPQN